MNFSNYHSKSISPRFKVLNFSLTKLRNISPDIGLHLEVLPIFGFHGLSDAHFSPLADFSSIAAVMKGS